MTQHELTVVLTRPRFVNQYRIRRAHVAEVILLSAHRSRWIADPDIVSICRDPRDDIFIAVALASSAEFLVTRDDDLKDDAVVRSLLTSVGCEVTTVTHFMEALGG